ncbi:hypothetical protein OMR58_22230 [Erwinia sp. INIA-01]|uniref:hypothetical protein n=1 Tax=Erwinia sp. INIA01 TaxID=2991500 RepID=UPI00222597AE|nr:hypothetical protein [Erwinia sp. INIA01]MCW1877169.1 hypothetical protein [Erwinia sp. INIA01]
MTTRPRLFYVSVSDEVMDDEFSDSVVSDLMAWLTDVNRMVVNCYHAGRAVTELVMHQGNGNLLCLSIWSDALSVPRVTPDDIRLSSKEIALPDTTDTLILVTKMARHAGLVPALSPYPQSSTVLEYIRNE